MDEAKAGSVPPFNPYFALVSGVLAISTGAIFARLADAPAIVIAAYRVGLATLLLAPVVWLKARDELFKLSMNELKLAVLAGFFLALHFALWISSLDYTSVANSVVLVNTNPLWVSLLAPIITKERMKAVVAVSIIISICGVLLIGAGDLSIGGKALLGDLLALLGSICAAVYLLLGRKLRRKLSLLTYIFICYGSAALFLWLTVIVLNMPATGFSKNTYAALWAIAIVPQLIGHSSYNWALKWFGTSVIAISLLGEPVGSTILAYIIFDEGLTWLKVTGGILILSAIYISTYSEKQRG